MAMTNRPAELAPAVFKEAAPVLVIAAAVEEADVLLAAVVMELPGTRVVVGAAILPWATSW